MPLALFENLGVSVEHLIVAINDLKVSGVLDGAPELQQELDYYEEMISSMREVNESIKLDLYYKDSLIKANILSCNPNSYFADNAQFEKYEASFKLCRKQFTEFELSVGKRLNASMANPACPQILLGDEAESLEAFGTTSCEAELQMGETQLRPISEDQSTHAQDVAASKSRISSLETGLSVVRLEKYKVICQNNDLLDANKLLTSKFEALKSQRATEITYSETQFEGHRHTVSKPSESDPQIKQAPARVELFQQPADKVAGPKSYSSKEKANLDPKVYASQLLHQLSDQRVKVLAKECAQYKSELDDSKYMLRAKDDRIQELKKEREGLQKKVARLEGSMPDITAELKDIRDANKRLEEQAGRNLETVQEQNKELHGAGEEIRRLQKEKSEAEEVTESFRGLINRYDQEKTSMREMINIYEQKFARIALEIPAPFRNNSDEDEDEEVLGAIQYSQERDHHALVPRGRDKELEPELGDRDRQNVRAVGGTSVGRPALSPLPRPENNPLFPLPPPFHHSDEVKTKAAREGRYWVDGVSNFFGELLGKYTNRFMIVLETLPAGDDTG